mmetsp:Transcript_22811/g.53287  ORF Transcript_22811/g.53287 Transcript_22811/m.53287 type:complete len:248 (+) Transcript_22811:917-1660(+)
MVSNFFDFSCWTAKPCFLLFLDFLPLAAACCTALASYSAIHGSSTISWSADAVAVSSCTHSFFAASWPALQCCLCMIHRACSTSFASCFSNATTDGGSVLKRSFHFACGNGARPLDSKRKSGSTRCITARTSPASRNDNFTAITGCRSGSTRTVLGCCADLAISHVNSNICFRTIDSSNGSELSFSATTGASPICCINTWFAHRACSEPRILSTRVMSSIRKAARLASLSRLRHVSFTSSGLMRSLD